MVLEIVMFDWLKRILGIFRTKKKETRGRQQVKKLLDLGGELIVWCL